MTKSLIVIIRSSVHGLELLRLRHLRRDYQMWTVLQMSVAQGLELLTTIGFRHACQSVRSYRSAHC